MTDHTIGTRQERQAARAELLGREKELTRMSQARPAATGASLGAGRQAVHAADRARPKALAELLEGRSQLAVYHFMFGPSYQAGCPTCSSMADGFDGLMPHLRARDVTLIYVSAAPIGKLLAYRERMGWRFTWASSSDSDFNADMGFSSTPEQVREWVTPMLGRLPPIASRNASETRTDVACYLTEGFGFSVFIRDGGAAGCPVTAAEPQGGVQR